jgi:hypothetical protein
MYGRWVLFANASRQPRGAGCLRCINPSVFLPVKAIEQSLLPSHPSLFTSSSAPLPSPLLCSAYIHITTMADYDDILVRSTTPGGH